MVIRMRVPCCEVGTVSRHASWPALSLSLCSKWVTGVKSGGT